jgi:hypothetical protein
MKLALLPLACAALLATAAPGRANADGGIPQVCEDFATYAEVAADSRDSGVPKHVLRRVIRETRWRSDSVRQAATAVLDIVYAPERPTAEEARVVARLACVTAVPTEPAPTRRRG